MNLGLEVCSRIFGCLHRSDAAWKCLVALENHGAPVANHQVDVVALELGVDLLPGLLGHVVVHVIPISPNPAADFIERLLRRKQNDSINCPGRSISGLSFPKQQSSRHANFQ